MRLPITDPVLIVAVATLIFLVAPMAARRFRVPGIIGVILAGAVVGPNGLNLLARDQTIILLGTVGLLYIIFVAGVELDFLGFRKYRTRSLVFGAISFLLPQVVGTGVGLLLGFGVATSILLASMFGSHTLVAYPIALRLGIAKNRAVTTAVGGTLVTDTSALMVLAVVAASTTGTLDAAFWIRLAVMLALYVAMMWYALPLLARWYFRNERSGGAAEYIFVLAALFSGAYLAEVAGVQPIIGAFLAGLALNRLIPEQSLLANRIRFVGEAFFIPFFLLSVGMLVDVRVLLGGVEAWKVMLGMTVTVVTMKGAAAALAGKLFHYSREETWTIYGLSVPQAAATLAAVLVGVEVGLFDDIVLNGAVLMILVTCLVGPWVMERYGREVALQEEQLPVDPGEAPQRILVPMSKPATAPALMDLALTIREPGSQEAVYPLTVVPDREDHSTEYVATAEKMLAHAVTHATGAGIPVAPLTRVDFNFANGISRGALETRATTLIIGWDGKRSARRAIFGTVLDQLLEQSRQQVLVTRMGHPLNTTDRILVLIPFGSSRLPGFPASVHTIKLMANRLGTTVVVLAVGGEEEDYRHFFLETPPEADVVVEGVEGWDRVPELLERRITPQDLVVLVGARRGAVSWTPVLDRLPGILAGLSPETFIILYPSDLLEEQEPQPAPPDLPSSLVERAIVRVEEGASLEEGISAALARVFPDAPSVVADLRGKLLRSAQDPAVELSPGVLVPHVRTGRVATATTPVVLSPAGVRVPGLEGPASVIFLMLTPEDSPGEHLRALAEIAAFARHPGRVRELLYRPLPEPVATP